MKCVCLGLMVEVVLYLFGTLLQLLCYGLSVPYLFLTLPRDLLLVLIFLWAVKSVPLLEARWLASVLLLFGVLFTCYVMASLFEGRFMLGLFYARVYLLPIMFFVTAKIALQSLDEAGTARMLRQFIVANALVLAVAVVLFLGLMFYPEGKTLIFGANVMPVAFFAVDDRGGMMRMALPMVSPNNLGMYFGMMLFLLLLLALGGRAARVRAWILVLLAALNMAGLAATLSRSSLLLVAVAVILLVIFVPALRSGRLLARGLLAGLVVVTGLGCGLLVIEMMSEGSIARWLSLNVSLQEPSLVGHWQSLVDAYDHFADYCLYGYPRGTVGPRAMVLNAGDVFNVENSVLSVIYDFGLIGAAVFFCGYALMLHTGYRSRLQLALLAGFFVCLQTLPYIFDPGAISLFLFIFVLIGHLDRAGYFSALADGGGGGRQAAFLRPHAVSLA